jgi:UDP-N-acetylglucosamine 2-epimerase
MALQVKKNARPVSTAPVVFFNASTRLQGMSLNAGFSLIASWSLQLQGVPVIQFVCDAGMSRCMLGSVLNAPTDEPPCSVCLAQSKSLYQHGEVHWFRYNPPIDLVKQVESLTLETMYTYQYNDIPLGELVLPAIRWVLRCYHLSDTEETRFLYRSYLLAAGGIARQFAALLAERKPQRVVVFNGMSFPEATARWVALQLGIPVITHEVGLQPFTAYFTEGHATAYPIEIAEDFKLSRQQNERLDTYLEQRFQGNFSMAGVRFWPTMKALSESFLTMAARYKQIVPVFTNVIFDTSQSHANVVFEHMFAWLDAVLTLAKKHPEALFVIRAHPDEARPGKSSRESVAAWAKQQRLDTIPNIVFVDATEYFSSYELIQRSKFVMIYNSTIGMEATLLGTPVLCAAKSRFTQLPTVYFPKTEQVFMEQAEEFLQAEKVALPDEFVENTRRFLYTQLYRVSLPFDAFLEEDRVWNGYVQLKPFEWRALLPENSEVLRIFTDGLLKGQPLQMDV